MPLVIICGKPSVGKTIRTNQLVDWIKNNYPNQKVQVVNDGKMNRNVVYSETRKEKEARGSLKSSVERSLSKDVVVVVDSLNYIKGCRYEMHCVAKYVRTTYCLIHVDAKDEEVFECNRKKPADETYSDQIIKELIMRFEEPNPLNRWDSPFFFVHGPSNKPLPYQKICEAIFDKKHQKANNSTQNPPLMSPDFVFEADKVIQAVAASILAAQRTKAIGEIIVLPGSQDTYKLKQKIGIGEMRRQRNQFLTFLKANPVADISLIPKNFANFLSNAL